LFRNNSCLKAKVNSYRCLHEVTGSDHRPVILDLQINDFCQPPFSSIERLLNHKEPEQGKGLLTFQIISISGFDVDVIERIGRLDPKAPATKLAFRLAFYSSAFDLENAPSLFSEEIEVSVDLNKRKLLQSNNCDAGELLWLEESVPQLHTALNTPELARQASFLMLLMGSKLADVN